MFKSIDMNNNKKQHVSLSIRVKELFGGLRNIENHKCPSLSLFLVCLSNRYLNCLVFTLVQTGKSLSMLVSTDNQLLHTNINLSLVCKSCTITNLRNQDPPELSCHIRKY